MSTLTVGTIIEKVADAGVAVDGVTLKDGGVGTTASPVPINSSSLNGGQFGGRRNIAYNGAMQVAQRGTTFSGVTASGTYPVDRFLFHVGSLGTWTLSQSTDVPLGQGFAKSIKCDVTTADASPSGTDYARIDHRFEGQDLQAFCKGTSNAKQFALSFYVKSAKTGTHIVELQDADNTRNISKAYTVSSANTWEKKELIIDADTTGAFDDDNAKSLTVAWWLSAGADYKSGTLATSWVSPTSANRVVGQENLADNTANNFFLTGVQLEVGSVATPFEHRSVGEEFALCQRYFQSYTDNGSGGGYVTNGTIISDRFYGTFRYQKQMRAIPSSFTTTSGGFNIQSSALSVGSISIDETHNATIDSVRFRTGSNSSLTNGQGAILRFDTGTIEINSEI